MGCVVTVALVMPKRAVKVQRYATLITELVGRYFAKEERRSALQAKTRLVNEVWTDRPAPGRRVRETVRSLAAMIRKIRKRRIDIVKKIDDTIELLIVRNVLQVVVLAEVGVKPDSRETASLSANVEERELVNVRRSGRIA